MLNLKMLVACAALSAGCLVANVGCADRTPLTDDQVMADPSGLPKDELLARGDRMIQRGQTMKDNAARMAPGQTADGMSKEDLAMKGDETMLNGQRLKDVAMRE